jgi:D-alanyl-D-alanine carboxypeptidase (penicillin-binding protein 5/6)
MSVALVAVLAGTGLTLGSRPWPAPYSVSRVPPVRQAPVLLDWPVTGSAAVGAVGYGVLAATGTAEARPMASTAKLITALTVLQRAPLSVGEAGPTLTVTPADVVLYQQYLAEDGSLVPVSAGEQFTEYQALQALLIPSADNIADSLAQWVYGSIPTYLLAANRLVAGLGLTETVVAGDASGFLPATVSTPSDLILLGQAALANPVIASIVAQRSFTLPPGPVAGTVKNTDTILGTDGIEGIKTGNTDQAGGVFVFEASHPVGGRSVTVIGAVMGAPTLPEAFAESARLLASTEANFTASTAVRAGQVVATYHVAWQGPVSVVAEHSLSVITWGGTVIRPVVTLRALRAPAPAHSSIGVITVGAGPEKASAAVGLKETVTPRPGWLRRLLDA